ncbi:uncharacterized protein LOC128222477 [Mya arenaria]|uniref:uncharacterized protein LOC128222477 n=1 Tax=Mya arenaria TaxID=6604 RepID=UPI0022E50B2B|nr:uncharacterized protein LOC128222477 [Mya arenaria]
MHDGDEWECSFADNGLSIKSNGLRIGGSNVSRTETEENRCFVETDKDSVAAKSLIMDKNDTINVQVNGTFVASCNHRNRTAELSEPEFKELFGISITPRGWCIFTVFNLTGTQHRINISSTSALKEVFIEHKAYPECMGPSNLDFTLKGKEGHTQEKEGHELEKEKNCSILSWLVGFFVLLPLGSGIGIAITCLFFKKDVCNVQRRILKGTQTPHAGESEGQETPDEERELTEQNPESNGEIHVGQNGGAQASHRGDTGPWARFVEYLRTCFHRNQ